MREEGMASVADVLFLALLVSLSCLVLVQATPSGASVRSGAYAKRAAQNTLLSLQKLPVRELDNFSYSPDMPFFVPSEERRFERKTLSQLIREDILLNPGWEKVKVGNPKENSGFSGELEETLKLALERLVGRRFGYRLIVRLDPIVLSWNRVLEYGMTIQNFENDSSKICSQSVLLNFSVPERWLMKGDNSLRYFGGYGDLHLVLELWSK